MATTEDLLHIFAPISNLFGSRGQKSKVTQALEQTRVKDAVEAQAAQARQDAINKALADVHTQREAGVSGARTNASKYFSDRGLDPSQYSGDINAEINQVLASTSPDDPNVGAYLGNLGQTIYSNREDAARQTANRSLNSIFTPDFERAKITDTTDDSILGDINTQQRGKADDFVNNLFKRGVINDTGRQGAEKNLDEQGSRVRTILDQLGQGTLETGRQNLRDVAGRGRAAAQTLDLGTNFDPSTFAGQSDQAFNDFIGKLGDSIKSKVPGDLYDTSGLSAIAGGAQGAQNFKFDPGALAGIINPDDPNAETDPNKKKKPASIF